LAKYFFNQFAEIQEVEIGQKTLKLTGKFHYVFYFCPLLGDNHLTGLIHK